jgi:lycopene epsilon-cyclase
MGLSGATISAPLGCRGLPRGAVGGGKARKAEAERWRRAGWSRRVGGPKVRCVATEKHDEAAAVGVEFADEEDYRKGGGGELLYVQMQATKPMESQSKIASKVIRFLISLAMIMINTKEINYKFRPLSCSTIWVFITG